METDPNETEMECSHESKKFNKDEREIVEIKNTGTTEFQVNLYSAYKLDSATSLNSHGIP